MVTENILHVDLEVLVAIVKDVEILYKVLRVLEVARGP